ncbi:hypothetical protein BV898_05709 [Hypsibius exemplaris]|uniref:F-box domain-containing protein n=1 Tax=Hypsibius exemplaris TaxID=2072580 RepID=A0A1W0WZ02_HYPEX|nr:hypothetical protein BV898_05709 [Hypsibius exemplaris]
MPVSGRHRFGPPSGRSARQPSDPTAVDPERLFSATLDQFLLRSLRVLTGEARQAVKENLRNLARASTGGFISITGGFITITDFAHKWLMLAELNRLMRNIELLTRKDRPVYHYTQMEREMSESLLARQMEDYYCRWAAPAQSFETDGREFCRLQLEVWKNLQNQKVGAMWLLCEEEFFIDLEEMWQRLLSGTSVRELDNTVASDWCESLKMARQQQRTERGCLELTERSQMLYEIDELMRLTRFQVQGQDFPHFDDAKSWRRSERELGEKLRAYSRQRWANNTVDGQTDGRSAIVLTEQWDHVKRDFDDWKAGWRNGLDYLTVHDGFFTGRGNMAFSLGVKSCVVVQTVGLMEAQANCSMEDLLDENGPNEASWVFEKAWLLNEMDRLMASIRDSLQGHGYYTCDLDVVAASEKQLKQTCDQFHFRFAARCFGCASTTDDRWNYVKQQLDIWKTCRRNGVTHLTIHDGFFTGRGNMDYTFGSKDSDAVPTLETESEQTKYSLEDLMNGDGPSEPRVMFEKAKALGEMDELMASIRGSLNGRGYYTCDLEVVAATERKLEESCDRFYRCFAGSAKITDKLHYCQEQYRIWKGFVHHYSPLWWATDGFISSLNDLPLRSLEDILLFTGTISQARIRRVCRRWNAIVSMSYISKCLNVEVPDIWTTISSAKIPVLSKGLSVMVTEHTHTITFIRPSVRPSIHPSIHPSVHPSDQPSIQPSDQPSVRPSVSPSLTQFSDELLNKLAGFAKIVRANASRRSPWALTLVNFEIAARTAHVWLCPLLASGQLFNECAMSRCRLLLPMAFPCAAVTVRNFSGTLTSSEKPMLAENFRRCFGRPVSLTPDMLVDVRQCTVQIADQVRDPAEQLRVRACLKNWEDWNQCDGFSEDISGIGAVIWQDIEVLTLVEIFVRKVLRDVRYYHKTHAMHVVMECDGGDAPNIRLINIIMTVYMKKEDRVLASGRSARQQSDPTAVDPEWVFFATLDQILKRSLRVPTGEARQAVTENLRNLARVSTGGYITITEFAHKWRMLDEINLRAQRKMNGRQFTREMEDYYCRWSASEWSPETDVREFCFPQLDIWKNLQNQQVEALSLLCDEFFIGLEEMWQKLLSVCELDDTVGSDWFNSLMMARQQQRTKSGCLELTERSRMLYEMDQLMRLTRLQLQKHTFPDFNEFNDAKNWQRNERELGKNTIGLTETLANCSMEDLLDENGPEKASWVLEKAWLLNEMDRLMAFIRDSLQGHGYYTCDLDVVAASEKQLEQACDRFHFRFAARCFGCTSTTDDRWNYAKQQLNIWKICRRNGVTHLTIHDGFFTGRGNLDYNFGSKDNDATSAMETESDQTKYSLEDLTNGDGPSETRVLFEKVKALREMDELMASVCGSLNGRGYYTCDLEVVAATERKLEESCDRIMSSGASSGDRSLSTAAGQEPATTDPPLQPIELSVKKFLKFHGRGWRGTIKRGYALRQMARQWSSLQYACSVRGIKPFDPHRSKLISLIEQEDDFFRLFGCYSLWSSQENRRTYASEQLKLWKSCPASASGRSAGKPSDPAAVDSEWLIFATLDQILKRSLRVPTGEARQVVTENLRDLARASTGGYITISEFAHKCRTLRVIDRLKRDFDFWNRMDRRSSYYTHTKLEMSESQLTREMEDYYGRWAASALSFETDGREFCRTQLDIWKKLQNQMVGALSLLCEEEFFIGLEGAWQRLLSGTSLRELDDAVASDWYESLKMARQQQRTERGCLELTERSRMLHEIDELMRITRFQVRTRKKFPYFYDGSDRHWGAFAKSWQCNERELGGKLRAYSRQRWANDAVDRRTDGETDGRSAIVTIEQLDHVKRDLDDWKVGWKEELDYLTVHDGFFTGRDNMAFSLGVKSCVVVQTVGLTEALANCSVEDLLDEYGPDEASWVFEKAWLLNEMDRLIAFIRDSLQGHGYYTCDLDVLAASEKQLEQACDRFHFRFAARHVGCASPTDDRWNYVKQQLGIWKTCMRNGVNHLTIHEGFFTGRGNMEYNFGSKDNNAGSVLETENKQTEFSLEDLTNRDEPSDVLVLFEKARALQEMDELMASIRSSLNGHGYYTCDLEVVAATERKLEESCDRYCRRFAGSAEITDKLNYCQEQYRIWKSLGHHYSPLWWATDGFISSLNDLPLRSLEDILLFTGTVGQARVRRVCRRWGAIVRMSYISKCLNVEVPDIWTTVSSAKIEVLSKGLSVMVMERTHAIAFIRPSVHPSVRPSVHPSVRPSVHPSVRPSVSQSDYELLIKLAAIAEKVQANADRRSPWALTLFNFEIAARTAYVWLCPLMASGQLFNEFALSCCRLLLPMPFPCAAVTVGNFSGTLTSLEEPVLAEFFRLCAAVTRRNFSGFFTFWEKPMLAEIFRRCLGRPDGLAPDMLADVRQCTDQLKDPAEQLRVRACLKNWDDWNRCDDFSEDISGIGAAIWQDIEVPTLVEIFVRKVLQDVEYNYETHEIHVAMECADGGAPNVRLINIIMAVYTKKDCVLDTFVRSLKVLL